MKTFVKPYDEVSTSYRAIVKGIYLERTKNPATGAVISYKTVEFEEGIGPYERKSALKGQITTYLSKFRGSRYYDDRKIVECEVEIQISSASWTEDEYLDTSRWIV